MITIKDVAELAGVSKATVSRALNNSGYVSPETKKKIDEIIEKYHYLPSASAVNLSKQETTTIGVVVPEIGNLFYADIVQGITRKADELNLSLVLFDTGNNMEREEKAIRVLQQQRVKGIILGPSIDYAESKRGKKLLKQLTDMHLPIVIFDRDFEQMPWDAVIYENYQSSYRAAQELYRAGNRTAAIIAGDMNLKIGRDRLDGFRKGAQDCGLELKEEDVLYGNFSMEDSYQIAKELLTRDHLPDAIYTCNNATTLGFLKAAKEVKRKAGVEIALIGNDRIDIVDILGMNISWIYRDTYNMGYTAMQLLQERFEHPDKPRSLCMIPYQVELNGSEKKKK